MVNILFIGNPNSVHDLKWVKKIVSSREVKGFFLSEFESNTNSSSEFESIEVGELPKIEPYSVWNRLRNRRIRKSIKSYVSDNNINLIHVFIGTSHVIIPSSLKVPVVLTTRGTDVNHTLTQLSKSKNIKDKILFSALKKSYKRINQITCTSSGQIETINRLVKLDVQPILIRTGVDIDSIQKAVKFNLDKTKEKKQVLFIRNIHKNYDPLLSVDAVNLIPKDRLSEIHFVFMKGLNFSKDLFFEMKKRLEENEVTHTFIDPLPNEKVWGLIKSSNLVVMNPLSDGTPNTALETMVSKTSLIMGYCKYDTDLFNNETTFFLGERSPVELSELILNILSLEENPKLENAASIVCDLASQEKEMKKVVNLYLKILKC